MKGRDGLGSDPSGTSWRATGTTRGTLGLQAQTARKNRARERITRMLRATSFQQNNLIHHVPLMLLIRILLFCSFISIPLVILFRCYDRSRDISVRSLLILYLVLDLHIFE